MKATEKVIIVFGLAGSGKSTLAAKLASHLGLRKVHPSGIMRQLLSGASVQPEETLANDGFWETPEGSRLLTSRLDSESPVDLRADQILLEEVAKGNVVIDSWSLPWLTEAGLRIHLKASLEVRAARAAARGGLELSDARALISKKDEDTRNLFYRLYGFDIKDVRSARFHLTLDTENSTPEEVFESALRFVQREWSQG